MTRNRHTRCPSCNCLLVIFCVMLLFCTKVIMGFVPSESSTNKKRSHLHHHLAPVSSLSFRKQVKKPSTQYHSSTAPHHHHHHAAESLLEHGPKFSVLSMMLRGGGGGGIFVVPSIMEGLAVQTASTTAYVSVLFLAVSNLAFLMAPNFMLETLYNVKPSTPAARSSVDAAAAADDVASTTFLRLIATVGLGITLSLYFAIIHNKKDSSSSCLVTAMGWGLVPRLIFFWYLLLFENRTNNSKSNVLLLPTTSVSFGSIQDNNRFFIVNTILTTWVAVSLLLGLGNPTMTARIFSTMSIIKSSLLIVRPLSVGSKFVGFDVSRKGMSKTRALLRILGNEFLVSAVFMASLAFGLNAAMAAGLAFTMWTGLLLDVAFISKPWNRTLLDDEGDGPTRPRMAQIINIVITIMFAAGFLVPFISLT